jgi:hypothetical protein
MGLNMMLGGVPRGRRVRRTRPRSSRPADGPVDDERAGRDLDDRREPHPSHDVAERPVLPRAPIRGMAPRPVGFRAGGP